MGGVKANHATLLKIEELKFSQCESSLFMVNSRESKMLDIEYKIIELKVKYLKSALGVEWVAGML